MSANLLENFALLATSEGGVAKLRELVFNLAAEGRLLEESVQESQFKALEEVVEFVMGQAPPGLECNTEGIGTVFVKAGEFGALYPVIREWTTKPLKLARLGDVLICVVGATIGKLNLAIDSAIGRSVAALRPSTEIQTKYLYYSLIPFTLKLRSDSRGSAQGVIGKSELSQVRVRVPPLDEQSRIVAKVEALMALCDRLEAQQGEAARLQAQWTQAALDQLAESADADEFARNWQALAEHFDTLFATPASIDALDATLLQLAVRGKLVPQNPADEPASELLKKIRAEKDRLIAAGQIKRDKPQPPIANDEKPFELPDGWEWAKIGAVCFIAGGIQKTPARTPVANHYPYLRVANVQRNRLMLSEIERFELSEGEIEKWRLQPDDLLIVEGNGSEDEIGRCAKWNGEIEDCVHQNHLIRVRPAIPEQASFILTFLNSPTGIAEMKRLAITTSGLYNLSVGKIQGIITPLPPLSEQSRIVAKLDALLALTRTLRARLTDARAVQARLASALVDEVAA